MLVLSEALSTAAFEFCSKSSSTTDTNIRFVFQQLPEPNRACLVGVYAFHTWNNLCDLVYPTATKSYQSQIPVAFGIGLPGHVTTKHLPDTPCWVLVGVEKRTYIAQYEGERIMHVRRLTSHQLVHHSES